MTMTSDTATSAGAEPAAIDTTSAHGPSLRQRIGVALRYLMAIRVPLSPSDLTVPYADQAGLTGHGPIGPFRRRLSPLDTARPTSLGRRQASGCWSGGHG